MHPAIHLPGRRFVFVLGVTALAVSGACPARVSAAAPHAEEGIPFVERFTPREYRAHSQSLRFEFDKRGLLHVANLVAVLQYDGSTWRRLDVPGTSTVYGLALKDDGRIYTGCSGQLGYFETDATGSAAFVSLRDRIPPELRSPDEAYREVVATSDGVFFQGVNAILRWRDGRFSALALPAEKPAAIFDGGGELFVFQSGHGLFLLRGELLEPVCDDALLKDQTVTRVRRQPDGSLLISILRRGVFRWHKGELAPLATPELQAFFSERLTSDVLRLASGEIAVATYQGGIAILDAQGEAIRWFNERNGLTSPLAGRLVQDAEGGLWCTQENGIARIEVHSPITLFDPRAGVSSSVTEFVRHEGALYVGSIRGVIRLVPADRAGGPARWVPIANTRGQSFGLESHRDGLLAGVDRRVFRIRGDRAEPVVDLKALVYALTTSSRDPDLVYASTRYGLAALRFRDGAWTNEGVMPALQHESRDLHEDAATGAIWFGTAAHGAGRITGAGSGGATWWDGAELTMFGPEHGLPDDGLALLLRSGGQNMFTTTAGVMEFDEASGRFAAVPREEIGPQRPGDWHWSVLARDSAGNTWGTIEPSTVIQDSALLELEFRTAAGTGVAVPAHIFDAAGNIMGLHLEEEAGQKILWIAGTEAVMRWDVGLAPTGITPSRASILMRRASLGETALPLDAADDAELAVAFGSRSGALRFEFASPAFDRDARPEFATRLEGFDGDWTPWGVETAREFSYLPSGRYRFAVRARTAAGGEAVLAATGFRVPPPWYLAAPAYAGYAVLALAVVAGIVRWRVASLHRRNDQLERTIAERTAELKSARDDADRANRAKSVFLANMSHELRTPLNGILGYTQILRRDPEISPRNQQRIGVLASSGEHLLRLINEVLDLSKIEAGRLELHPVASDVRALAQAVVEALRPRFGEKRLEFNLALDPSLPERVLIDEQKIGQVLFNLLGNAVKFTEKGSVDLRVSAVHDDHNEPWLRFEVSDTGIGIPPGQQATIFEPFRQVTGGVPSAEGTGLGLAICARIVELMSGKLRLESTPGRGSRFWFEIPAHAIEASTAATAPGSSQLEVIGYEGARRRVLVVDDVPVNRDVIVELLMPLGFSVETAADGAAAIAAVRARPPDLVLMDLRMAPMSGVEAVKRLRADESLRGLRIVAFSASTIGFTSAQALEIGCDDLLSKPFREAELLSVLERQLRIQWRRGGPVTTGGSRPRGALPTISQAGAVVAAARRGDAATVREELGRLAAGDPSLREWTGDIEQLAERFQMQEIRRRLESLPD